MQINKISVGVESLPEPVKIEVISASRVKKIREIISSVSRNILRSFTGLYLNIRKLLSSITAKMKKGKTEEEILSVKETGEDRKFRLKPQFKLKKGMVLIIILILLITVAVVAKVRLTNFKNTTVNPANGDKLEIKGPLKTMEINKEFQFPVRDTKGKEITKFKYLVQKAELRDEIIVKGQKATAVQGRVFLVIYLKITNEYSQKLDIPSKNYMRLSTNGNEDEWLASDIHNDPVEVQAQSTKVTRLGFPIYESDNKLVLRIGEIDGNKERIELNF